MIHLVVFLFIPLIVFAISSGSVKRKPCKKSTKQSTAQASISTSSEPKPKAPATQLDLFLDDDDFDITDLINADRRNK